MSEPLIPTDGYPRMGVMRCSTVEEHPMHWWVETSNDTWKYLCPAAALGARGSDAPRTDGGRADPKVGDTVYRFGDESKAETVEETGCRTNVGGWYGWHAFRSRPFRTGDLVLVDVEQTDYTKGDPGPFPVVRTDGDGAFTVEGCGFWLSGLWLRHAAAAGGCDSPAPTTDAATPTATRYEFRPPEMFRGDPMDTRLLHDPDAVTVEWRGGDRWAISEGSWSPRAVWCEATQEWEYEPLPSERSEDFCARTRYTLADALAIGARLAASVPSDSPAAQEDQQ